MAWLLSEWALGETEDEFDTEWTERGRALEPEARDYYQFHRDAEVKTVGLIYRDADKTVGASPDGTVGDSGLIELKCPKAHTHLRWLSLGVIPRTHAMQVQGQLWVSGREWCDFTSYHPGLPPLIVRAEPEEKFQEAFDVAIPQFIGEMLEARERLRAMGVRPVSEWKPEPGTVGEILESLPQAI